jgi:hypothetical protein
MPRFTFAGVLLALAIGTVGCAHAQGFPSKPVRMFVP